MDESESEPLVEGTKNLHNQWNCLRTAISETQEKLLPKKNVETKQKWITQEILDLMENRRNKKGMPEYNILNNKIKKECIKAKEDWANKKCEKIEELSKHHNTRAMFKEIKDFNKETKEPSGCIKNKAGDILFETESTTERWTE